MQRLSIKEHLGIYNMQHKKALTMHALAQLIYNDRDNTEASKYQRLMAINAGRAEATVTELVKLSEFFNINCCEIII